MTLHVEVFPIERQRWIAVINAESGSFSTEASCPEDIPGEVAKSVIEVLRMHEPKLEFKDELGGAWSPSVGEEQLRRMGL
jgi:hypothetical protein